MATVRATFFDTTTRASDGIGKAVEVPTLRGATGLDELTSGGTADNLESGASEWTAPSDGFVEMYSDGAVWVSGGASPTAAVGTDFYLPANEVRYYGVTSGDKISVIDDS